MQYYINKNRDDLIAIFVLSLSAIAFSIFQFQQPIARLHTDPSRWMSEALRAAGGQIPYLDFSWQYPPFAIWISSLWVRVCGESLLSFQLMLSIISFIISLIIYLIFKRFVTSRESLFCTITVILLCSFSRHQRMFSLNCYTPSIMFAVLFSLASINAYFSYIKTNHKFHLIILASCLSLSICSKPDFLIASLFLFIWTVFYIYKNSKEKITDIFIMIIISIISVFLSYYSIIEKAGVSNVLNGVTGYGIAKIHALNIVSEKRIHEFMFFDFPSIFVFIIISTLYLHQKLNTICKDKIYKFLSGINMIYLYVGLFLFWGCNVLLMTSFYGKYFYLYQLVTGSLIWFGPCYVIVYIALHKFNALTSGKFRSMNLSIAILLAYLSFAVCRGYVFGILYFSNSQVVCAIIGLFSIIALSRTVICSNTTSSPLNALLGIAFAILFTLKIISANQPDKTVIATAQGNVCVSNDQAQPLKETLDFLQKNITGDEYFLCVPCGEGLNYLSGIPSPLFQTQFVWHKMPTHIEHNQIALLKMHPPKFIISQTENLPYLTQASSREFNPALWQYIDSNYTSLHVFTNNFISYEILGMK